MNEGHAVGKMHHHRTDQPPERLADGSTRAIAGKQMAQLGGVTRAPRGEGEKQQGEDQEDTNTGPPQALPGATRTQIHPGGHHHLG